MLLFEVEHDMARHGLISRLLERCRFLQKRLLHWRCNVTCRIITRLIAVGVPTHHCAFIKVGDDEFYSLTTADGLGSMLREALTRRSAPRVHLRVTSTPNSVRGKAGSATVLGAQVLLVFL